MGGQEGGFVGLDGGVEGEGAVGWAAGCEGGGVAAQKIVSQRISFLSRLLGLMFDNVPDHTIAFLEALNARADFVDFTRDIAADDRRELLDEDPGVLLVPVDGVDGDGGVLDDDLAGTCGWHWGRADFEGSVCLLEPGGLVLWGGHVDCWLFGLDGRRLWWCLGSLDGCLIELLVSLE